MVQSPLDLIDEAYACLDDGDVLGADRCREELLMQMHGRIPQAMQPDYNSLCDSITEIRNKTRQLTSSTPTEA